jgi:hypothetical protein
MDGVMDKSTVIDEVFNTISQQQIKELENQYKYTIE